MLLTDTQLKSAQPQVISCLKSSVKRLSTIILPLSVCTSTLWDRRQKPLDFACICQTNEHCHRCQGQIKTLTMKAALHHSDIHSFLLFSLWLYRQKHGFKDDFVYFILIDMFLKSTYVFPNTKVYHHRNDL